MSEMCETPTTAWGLDGPGQHESLQLLPEPLPVSPELAAAATELLIGTADATSLLEHVGQLLAERDDLDEATVALTRRAPTRTDGWVRHGDRAWTRTWSRHTATLDAEESADGSDEQTLSLPWLSVHGARYGLVAVPDTHLLPPEAAVDRAECGAQQVRSMLAIPIRYDGQMYGSIGLGRRTTGPWSPELAGGLKLLGAAAAARLEQERCAEAVNDAVRHAEDLHDRQQRFFRTLGHELRTPLTAVLGAADMLTESLHDAGLVDLADDAALVTTAGEQLLGIVNELLLTAHAATPTTTKPVPVLAAVRDVAHWLASLARTRQVSLVIDIADDLAVAASGTGLRQIITNLVSNAVLYNRPGGHVRIHARRSADLAGSERVHITVADTGPGLTEQQRQTVFEPLVRFVPTDAPGSGLGLAIARTATEQFGGTLGVECPPDGGCEFWLDLPAVPAETRDVRSMT